MTTSRSHKSRSSTIVALNSAVPYPGNNIAIIPLYSYRIKRADLLRFKPIVLLLVQIYRTEFCHGTIKKDISGLGNSEKSSVSLNYSFGYPHTTELRYHFCIYCTIPFLLYFILQNYCQPLHYLHYNHCQEWKA